MFIVETAKTFEYPEIAAESQYCFSFLQLCSNNKHTAKQNSNKFVVIEIQYNDLRAILDILRHSDSRIFFYYL